MPDSATCDHCNGSIPKGGGYTFYSTAAMGMPGMLQETGNMMLCQRCADEIVSAAGYAKELPAQREITGADLIADPMLVMRMLKEHNADSIVKLCKRHGFTPEQAHAKGRELAQAWWSNPQAAQLKSQEFWKSAPPSQDARPGGCATAIVTVMCAIGASAASVVLWLTW